jgi:signal transduction histidine kinase/CRP-like cAMP-binding protein
MTEDSIGFLKSSKLFRFVRDEDIHQIATFLTEHSYKEGEYIFRQGSTDQNLYLVRNGKVGIYIYAPDGNRILIMEGEGGDFFGELELLDGLPRSADAVAHTDTGVLIISFNCLQSIVKRENITMSNIVEQVSQRLRRTNQFVAQHFERNMQQMRIQHSRLSWLIEAAKSVNSSLDLDTVLRMILDMALQATSAERGTLYIADHTKKELWSKLLFGEDVNEIRLPFGKGIAGYVAETGQTINTEDTSTNPHFNPEVDNLTGYKTKNMLCMPMRNKKSEIIGVLQLLNKINGSFNTEDEIIIEALSLHASIALDNARLHAAIVENERLSVVGRMANTIIHDLKAPINTIKGYTQMLKSQSGNEEAVEIANNVISQADRLIKMVQEILDYSKGDITLEMRKVNVKELIMTMFRFLSLDFKERNIIIDMDIAYDGEWDMDVDKMSRVFFNIASNAADAMKEGGQFTIRATEEENKLKIEFSDTGVGMRKEVLSRLFEPFFTYGKKYGTGLGMAIVKKIIEDHGGSISVDSQEGKGSHFTILLPRD